jgi:ParB/RepB/Spo0J family partition protein
MKGSGFSIGNNNSPSSVNSNNELLQDVLRQELEASGSEGRFLSLNPALIQPDPDQPRKSFEESSIKELSESIKENGQAQAITVKTIGDNLYQIIAGERRWRAACYGGFNIEVVIKDGLDKESTFLLQLIENISRENMDIKDTAGAYVTAVSLLEEKGLSKADAIKKTGLNKVAFYRWAAVNKMYEEEAECLSLVEFTSDTTALEAAYKLEKKSPKDLGKLIKKLKDGKPLGSIREALTHALKDKDRNIEPEEKIESLFELGEFEKIDDYYLLSVISNNKKVKVKLTNDDIRLIKGVDHE